MLFLLNDYHERIREIVAVGIEKGEISRSIQPEAASILFLGALQHLLTIFRLTDDEREVDLASEEVFSLLKTTMEGGNEA
ncbi:MAG: hypothetical protein JRJ48_06610 [Deltaproteobacteria bacterium]|nr:hypothetical protein [Deltaproteobacteria bacterium]